MAVASAPSWGPSPIRVKTYGSVLGAVSSLDQSRSIPGPASADRVACGDIANRLGYENEWRTVQNIFKEPNR